MKFTRDWLGQHLATDAALPAIAERLTALGIPFAFSTGYGADRVPAAFADRPRLPKPCPTEALEAVLRRPDELPPQHPT